MVGTGDAPARAYTYLTLDNKQENGDILTCTYANLPLSK